MRSPSSNQILYMSEIDESVHHDAEGILHPVEGSDEKIEPKVEVCETGETHPIHPIFSPSYSADAGHVFFQPEEATCEPYTQPDNGPTLCKDEVPKEYPFLVPPDLAEFASLANLHMNIGGNVVNQTEDDSMPAQGSSKRGKIMPPEVDVSFFPQLTPEDPYTNTASKDPDDGVELPKIDNKDLVQEYMSVLMGPHGPIGPLNPFNNQMMDLQNSMHQNMFKSEPQQYLNMPYYMPPPRDEYPFMHTINNHYMFNQQVPIDMGSQMVPPWPVNLDQFSQGISSAIPAPIMGDDIGVRMEDPAVLTAQARHQVKVAGLTDEQLANVYSPHKLTPLEEFNSLSGLEATLELMPWHPGMSFSLGEAGREVLRAYVRQKAGLKGQKMQNISIPKLLKMAHDHGLWPAAVRAHLEHCGRLPMSLCHHVMKTYKESLNMVRRRNRKAFMRSSLTAAAYHCCHDSIPYQEGLALRLGSEGRKQLLDVMREKHVRDREQVDRLLAAEGLCYSDMRNASLPVLFKMAHTMGLWNEAVRLHLEYSSKGGGQVGAVSYRIQRRHEWRTRTSEDSVLEDLGILSTRVAQAQNNMQTNLHNIVPQMVIAPNVEQSAGLSANNKIYNSEGVPPSHI
eukprot:Platyproteum_vivax@DN3568_c0_g1_i1.p1